MSFDFIKTLYIYIKKIKSINTHTCAKILLIYLLQLYAININSTNCSVKPSSNATVKQTSYCDVTKTKSTKWRNNPILYNCKGEKSLHI